MMVANQKTCSLIEIPALFQIPTEKSMGETSSCRAEERATGEILEGLQLVKLKI